MKTAIERLEDKLIHAEKSSHMETSRSKQIMHEM